LPVLVIAKESKLKSCCEAIWGEREISAIFGNLGTFGNSTNRQPPQDCVGFDQKFFEDKKE
jgi:hypothetical protein